MWICCRVTCQNNADRMANSVDPDQTAPLGVVWSGSTLFAQTCLFTKFSIITVMRKLIQIDLWNVILLCHLSPWSVWHTCSIVFCFVLNILHLVRLQSYTNLRRYLSTKLCVRKVKILKCTYVLASYFQDKVENQYAFTTIFFLFLIYNKWL